MKINETWKRFLVDFGNAPAISQLCIAAIGALFVGFGMLLLFILAAVVAVRTFGF